MVELIFSESIQPSYKVDSIIYDETNHSGLSTCITKMVKITMFGCVTPFCFFPQKM